MMMDVGQQETDKVLVEIEKRISMEYARAEKEVAAKLSDYLKKFEVKDALKQKALANGLITEEEYKQWRIGQMMIGKRWAEMRDSLAQDFTNADKIAKSIAFGYQPDVYAINHNYGTFEVEKGSRLDTSYTLYDRHTVEELMKNEDEFIPAPGRKITREINEGKTLAWNKKAVQSAMMQGILQGESIPKMATRLANTVGESDRKAAIRNARTMTTGVENAGRTAAYDRANKLGIETQKMWSATFDRATRHWHAALDRVAVDNDKPFVNEFGEIMYPGDPKAHPSNIFNCRCALSASIKGFPRENPNAGLTYKDELGTITYDEWKAGHYKQKSDRITKQEEIAETMRNAYGAEYNDYKDLTTEVKAFKVNIGDAKDYVDHDTQKAIREYGSKMAPEDRDAFNNIFSQAEYGKSETDISYYDPSDKKIHLKEENISDYTVYHEGTHWLDERQNYQITEDWGHYEYKYDDDWNVIGQEWVPNITVVKEHGGFSEYIAHEWQTEKPGMESAYKKDMENITKILGTSGDYNVDRPISERIKDREAIYAYLDSKGVKLSDPDYIHLSDFISVLTWDANLGYNGYGGHRPQDMTTAHLRVLEVTAGYNVLNCIGRKDYIAIEEELAPNLMAMIKKEWNVVWQKAGKKIS